jgi:hypothetical protein
MMSQTFQSRVQAVDRTMLTPLVQQTLDSPTAEVLDWKQQPLGGGAAHASEGIIGRIQFSGQARVQEAVVPWSLVLKAFAPPPGYTTAAPTAWNYWKREVLTYQSDLLADLGGGLVAPRCLTVLETPTEEYWIWMEYVVEAQPRWPLERYQLAARHLGQFNGSYLVNRALPTYPWLNRGHIGQWLALGEPGLQALPRLSHHPRSWVTGESTERALRLSSQCKHLLEQVERLPPCLCHHDTFRRNLLARRTPGGEDQTVLIDWSAVGPGVIGEDLAQLVTMSTMLLEVPAQDLARLDKLAFAGYLAGLTDVGWRGDEEVVRLGYTASAALLFALAIMGILLPGVEDEASCASWAQTAGHPLEVLLSQWQHLQQFVLDLGDEAQTLLQRMPVCTD